MDLWRQSNFPFKYVVKTALISQFRIPQVLILISGVNKAYALRCATEEGVNHMYTVSAFQQHPKTIFVVDDDATLELKVRTVKYFKGLMDVHNKLIEDPEDPCSPPSAKRCKSVTGKLTDGKV